MKDSRFIFPQSKIFFIIFIITTSFVSSCKKDSINIFSLEDDKNFGLKTSEQIASDPATYPILDPVKYPDSYNYLKKVVNNILNSGKVKYKDDFKWEVKIIKKDDELNAFATPGGYLYFYTGLIKYLDSEDQFAGVVAHEMAHSDKRHATTQLTKIYGISVLLEVALGKNPGMLAEIAASLISLKFSRDQESEADEYSVIYLCPTSYNADGAAAFFDKLIKAGESGNTPAFLSTHPSPDNRIENIKNKKKDLNCSGQSTFSSEYTAFKNGL